VTLNLKKLGSRKYITQEPLAQVVGVSRITLARWEAGTREPRASDIKKLCEVLGVSEAELLNGPVKEDFTVTLKYVKTLEGVDEEMNMNGITLSITEDGFVRINEIGG
jgi:transcriptional regulator with XRE-family HTH domain